ncbi:Serine/threonine-protein kinase SRPK [Leucoagaricus sp. SymC.cos]|nr:Serine/threonine-protein kinase SRPK [Leucoagaricus sp. SymC.cos]
MHLLSKLHPSRYALSLSTLSRRVFSSHKIPQKMGSEDWRLREQAFRQELKTIDPKDLAEAMGGDKPPEEDLLSSFDDGLGYFTTAAPKRWLKHYWLVRKLGWASSSTVWLASDESERPRKFVALKFLTSQATAQITHFGSPEFDVFLKINAAGHHTCFVTEALTSSLTNLREPGKNRFALPIAKRITRQVLLGLDFLHRECGYIHTVVCQDLKTENILTSPPEPVASRIVEYVGLKGNHSIICGLPLELKSQELPLVFAISQPLPYLDLGGSLEDISVRIIDYGQATSAKEPVREPVRDHYYQPDLIRAPEVTLRYPWISAIDIWTVGCVLFQLLTEQNLFGQDPGKYTHELHLQRIEECLGPFPLNFLKDCKDREKYFDGKGKLLHTDNDYAPTPIEDILRALEAVDKDEILGTAGFLGKCFTLDPKLRPSAQELLKDDWLM